MQQLVKINFQDLVSPIIRKTQWKEIIKNAFGESGLGLIEVQNIPGLKGVRNSVLKKGYTVHNLPKETISQQELPSAFYSVGQSQGKENFNGVPDLSKSSQYARPNSDDPRDILKKTLSDVAQSKLMEQFGFLCHQNVWVEEVEGQEESFKAASQMILDVGLMLCRHIDSYCENKIKTQEPYTMSRLIMKSQFNTGRQLYQQGKTQLDKGPFQSQDQLACGWHNDHGMLTGLLPAMYQEHVESAKDQPICKETKIKDSQSGLHILSRNGTEHRISVKDENSMVFQIGETMQLLSGGLLRATPHSVKHPGPEQAHLGRSTLALFMEPCLSEKISIGRMNLSHTLDTQLSPVHKVRDVLESDDIVPSIATRFADGMTFGQFHQNTILAFADD